MAKRKKVSVLTIDDVTDWWQTEIVDIAPGVIRVRGYAIEELIGRISFPAMIWLVMRGELPSDAEAELLGAVLVAGVDHGPQAPAVAIARMAATCGVGLNSAMASGVNVLGDVHGGAGQQCMELIADIDGRRRTGAPLSEAVVAALKDFRAEHGRFVPGFGHRFHPVDPRAKRLSKMIRSAARKGTVSDHYLVIGEAIQKRLSSETGRSLPMNIDGITAVVLSELGFPPELGRGIFILSRSVGICAHAFEQSRQGGRIKGPTPPAAGFRYRGVKPRKLKAKRK